jgi:hypothetical protein
VQAYEIINHAGRAEQNSSARHCCLPAGARERPVKDTGNEYRRREQTRNKRGTNEEQTVNKREIENEIEIEKEIEIEIEIEYKKEGKGRPLQRRRPDPLRTDKNRTIF